MKRIAAMLLSAMMLFCACRNDKPPASWAQEPSSSQAASSASSSQEEASSSEAADASDGERAPLPDGSYPLLEDRLRATLPEKGEYTDVYPNGIMGTAASHQSVTKITWGKSGVMMWLQANELFLAGGGSFEEDAKQFISDIGDPSISVRMLPDAACPVALLERAEADRVVRDSDYMSMALAQASDGMLIFLTVTVSGIRQEQLPQYLTQAEKIFSSLQQGERTIGEAGTVKLGDWQFEQAQGYTTLTEQGVDFDVFRIKKILRPDSRMASYATIYIGAHPSPMGEGMEMTPTEQQGEMLGKPVTWQVYQANGATLIETLFPYEGMTQMHVYLVGEDDATTTELLKMLETLA